MIIGRKHKVDLETVTYENAIVMIDGVAIPGVSADFITMYGLRQYLQDGGAGAETEADFRSGVMARLEKLRTGDLSRSKAERSGEPDDEQSLALTLAKQMVRDVMKANKLEVPKGEALTERAQAVLKGTKGPDIFAEAARRIKARKAVAKATLDADNTDVAKALGL